MLLLCFTLSSHRELALKFGISSTSFLTRSKYIHSPSSKELHQGPLFLLIQAWDLSPLFPQPLVNACHTSETLTWNHPCCIAHENTVMKEGEAGELSRVHTAFHRPQKVGKDCAGETEATVDDDWTVNQWLEQLLSSFLWSWAPFLFLPVLALKPPRSWETEQAHNLALGFWAARGWLGDCWVHLTPSLKADNSRTSEYQAGWTGSYQLTLGLNAQSIRPIWPQPCQSPRLCCLYNGATHWDLCRWWWRHLTIGQP
jgi:hypothetical protein